MEQKIIDYFRKSWRDWVFGIIAIGVLYLSRYLFPVSKIVDENDLVTGFDLLIIWWLFSLKSLITKRSFIYEAFPHLDDRISKCENQEKRLAKNSDILVEVIDEKFSSFTDKINGKMNELQGVNKAFGSRLGEIEDKLKRLSIHLSNHTDDCEEKYECQFCSYINDFDSGICDRCLTEGDLIRVKRTFHKSKKPSSPKKKTKRKSKKVAIKR